MTRKKTRLLLVTLGLVGACLVLWLGLSALSYPIDRARYDGIHNGMSKADVESQIGVKSGYHARRGNPCLTVFENDVDQTKRTGWWIGNQYAIAVQYDDEGRVEAKALYRVTWIDPVSNALLHLGHRAGFW